MVNYMFVCSEVISKVCVYATAFKSLFVQFQVLTVLSMGQCSQDKLNNLCNDD